MLKNQNVSQQSQSATKQHLQQYLEERKRNRSKNSEKKNLKNKNMFVTCMQYCQECELLFIGLINQEVKIFKFCYNEKNLTYYVEKKELVKGPDVPKCIELARHRSKE